MQRGQGGGRQLALTSRLGSVSGESLRRTALVGLICVLAAALLSACDDGPTATPTGPSAETTDPMPANSTPAPTPVPPTATPAPTPTPDPTATPTPPPAAPTPGPPTGAGAQRDFDIDSDTLWRELMDTLTASEQSCIRDELGDEVLKSVLERRAMSEGDTQQWEVSIFGCLALKRLPDYSSPSSSRRCRDSPGRLKGACGRFL